MKIIIVGTFDVDNYGDCLFPDIISYELKRRMKSVDIKLFSPTSRVSRLGNYSVVEKLPGNIEEFQNIQCDAIILAGGEVIQNGHSSGGLYSVIPPNTMSAGMRLWMCPAIFKYRQGIPYIINAVGVGHIDEEVKRGLSSVFNYADHKTVRDENSSNFLKKINCPTRIGLDCAFLMPTLFEPNKFKKIAKSVLPDGLQLQSYLIVQASIQYINKKFKRWCRAVGAVARLANVPILLLPLCYHHSDRVVLRRALPILKKNGLQVFMINKYLKTTETASIIAHSSGYCGTSLHGAITAVSYEKPVAVFCPKTSKHVGVLKTVGAKESTTDNLEKLYCIYQNSMKSDRKSFAQRGIEGASSELDLIVKVIEKTSQYRKPTKEEWQNINHAIEADKSYYKKNPLLKIKRPLFQIVRSTPYSNELWDFISCLFRKRFR